MPISSPPSDLLLNVELSTDIATQDELDSLANSIVGTPEDSGDEMTLNGLKKKDEILSERIGSVSEKADEALAAANTANTNASAALEGVSALSGRVSGLEGRVQQVEENVQTLETGVQTAMANAEAAVTTAAGADTKATAAATAVATLDGKVAAIEEKDVEQDGKISGLEGRVDAVESTVETVNGKAEAAKTAATTADTKATTAVATANNAKTTADAADEKAEAAEAAVSELNGKVATLERNDAEQDGRLDTIEGQIPNLALKTDIHDGTLQVTVNGAGGFTFTANQAENTSYDIVVPSTDDFVAKSDFDDLSGRVNHAEGEIDQFQNDVQDLGNRVTSVEGNVEQALADADSAYRLAESAKTEAETAGSTAGEAMTKANSVEGIANNAQELAERAQSAADAAQSTADAAQSTADGAATSAITNAGSIEQIYSQIGEIINGYYRYSYNRTQEGQHSQYDWYDFYIGSGECTDLYGNHYFPDGNEYEGGVLYSSDRAQILIGYTSENNVGIWYRTCSERDEHGQRIINPWTILDTMKSPLPMYSPYQNLGEWLVTVDSILGSLPSGNDIICQEGSGGNLYKGGNSSNLLQEPPKIQSHQLALVDSIAREYNGGSYDSGDYITYRGYLYRCLSATSGGNFNPNYWKEVSVTDEISDNLSALSSELGNIAAILDNINGVNL